MEVQKEYSEVCSTCSIPILTDQNGMVISKYWRSKFRPDMRVKIREVVEVYCGAKCSLESYEKRGRKN